MAGRKKSPRELAARALCQLDGHPEETQFERQPMWKSFLPQVDAVLAAVLPPDELERLRQQD
jgi:hypothetical protein